MKPRRINYARIQNYCWTRQLCYRIPTGPEVSWALSPTASWIDITSQRYCSPNQKMASCAGRHAPLRDCTSPKQSPRKKICCSALVVIPWRRECLYKKKIFLHFVKDSEKRLKNN